MKFTQLNKFRDNSKAYGIFEFTRSQAGVIRTKTTLTRREQEATTTQRRTKDPWNWEIIAKNRELVSVPKTTVMTVNYRLKGTPSQLFVSNKFQYIDYRQMA